MLQALLCLVCAIGSDVECNPGPKDGPLPMIEVYEVLTKWEAASREIKTSKLKFTRIIYNLVFEAETRGECELFCRMPNDMRIIIRPAEISRNQRADRRGRSGNLFRLESDQAGQWIWTPNQQVIVDVDEKDFLRRQPIMFDKPLPGIGEINGDFCAKTLNVEATSNLFDQIRFAICCAEHPDFTCPFLLSINAENLKSLWSFKAKQTKQNEIFLVATPTAPLLKQFYSECQIIIDTKDWQTKAIKIIDPVHNLETVFVINDRTLNPELPADTFNPDLKSMGYKDRTIDDDLTNQSPK